MRIRDLLALAALVPGFACSQYDDRRQDISPFAQAIQNRSTSPSFVKITVIESSAKREFTTCVTANLFLGAMHKEHDLPYSDSGSSAVAAIATSNHERIFTFDSSAALDNMPWHPSASELSEAEALLVGLTSENLRESLGSGSLLGYYADSSRRRERMAAMACALIDLGYAPRLSDIGGALYVE